MVKEKADEIRKLKDLKNLCRRIGEINIKEKGYYTFTENGKKIYVEE